MRYNINNLGGILMVKLIATDMDGTLLDDKKNLPENFDNILHQLNQKNIKFVFASGRSFNCMKLQFSKYLDNVMFICDNGAYIYLPNQPPKTSILSKNSIINIITFCENLGLTVLLCGKNGSWHNAQTEKQNLEISTYYINQVKLDNLCEFQDDIFKIAIFEENGIEHDAYPKIVNEFGNNFNIQLSGNCWVDIMNKNVTKGQALRSIQKRLGIDYGETMAFGDYLNDVEMLENSYYSFAMENSHESIKKSANFFTGTNNENSVIKEIVKYAL